MSYLLPTTSYLLPTTSYLLPTTSYLLPKDIIIHCITSLTTSIMSVHNMYNFIIEHKSSDYHEYQLEIVKTDMINNILIATSIIKDILKAHYFNKDDDMEKLLEQYKKSDMFKCEHMDDFNVISFIDEHKLVANIPQPVQICLRTTLEIIDKLNLVLEQIKTKIEKHDKSFTKYISRICLKNELKQIKTHNELFEKRLDKLISIIKLYPNVLAVKPH